MSNIPIMRWYWRPLNTSRNWGLYSLCNLNTTLRLADICLCWALISSFCVSVNCSLRIGRLNICRGFAGYCLFTSALSVRNSTNTGAKAAVFASSSLSVRANLATTSSSVSLTSFMATRGPRWRGIMCGPRGPWGPRCGWAIAATATNIIVVTKSRIRFIDPNFIKG